MTELKSEQYTQNVEPMLIQYWAIIYDAGPTLNQHWANDSYLPGIEIIVSQLFCIVVIHIPHVAYYRNITRRAYFKKSDKRAPYEPAIKGYNYWNSRHSLELLNFYELLNHHANIPASTRHSFRFNVGPPSSTLGQHCVNASCLLGSCANAERLCRQPLLQAGDPKDT